MAASRPAHGWEDTTATVVKSIGPEEVDMLESRLDALLAKHCAQLHDRLLKSLQHTASLAVRADKKHHSSKRFASPAEGHSTRSSLKDGKFHAKTYDSKPGAKTLEGLAENPAALALPPGAVAGGGGPGTGAGNTKHVPSLIEMESAILHGIGSIRFPVSSSSVMASSNYQLDQFAEFEAEADADGSEEELRGAPHPPTKLAVVVPHPCGVPPTSQNKSCSIVSEGSLQLPLQKPAGTRAITGDKVVFSPRNGQAIRSNNMENMIRDSQSMILDQLTADPSTSKLEQVAHDPASKLMLAFPSWLHMLVALLTFGNAAAYITVKILGYIESNSSVFAFVSTTVYGILATICVHLLRKALRSTDLNLAVDRLHLFVADFELHWSKVSGQEWRGYAVVWCVIVLIYAATQGAQAWVLQEGDSTLSSGLKIVVHCMQISSVLSFALSSAVVMLAAYVQSHLLLGLDKSLDCWCCQVINTPAFEFGVQSWNSLQALLKCVGRELASSFLSFQVMGALGFFYVLASSVAYAFRTDFHWRPILLEFCSSLPLLFLFGMSMRLFAKGAALTEKCRAVPAFVNQIPTTHWIDVHRQYLVTFITDSSAGFFVREVKISQELFLKQFIIVGGLLSGIFGALSRLFLS